MVRFSPRSISNFGINDTQINKLKTKLFLQDVFYFQIPALNHAKGGQVFGNDNLVYKS